MVESRKALEGIYAKLERANECIGNLNSEINKFLLSDPRPYAIRHGFYDDPLKYVFKAYSVRPVPLRISVLTGEIIHHFRSCLDHLIVALAVRQGQRPLNNHQFPICRNREKFKKACAGGQIKGIGNRAFRRVVKAQPFLNPAPNTATISAIHQLDIKDKHSVLLLVTQMACINEKVYIGREGQKFSSVPSIVSASRPTPRHATENGEEVFSITLASPVPDFYADAEFDVQIAFGDIGTEEIVPIIPGLAKMGAFTLHTVNDFSALL